MLRITIVQQGAWDMPLDSMPLAAGYLKTVLDADADLGPATTTTICNFRGGATLPEMTRRLFSEAMPDVLAFSVFGWNYRRFGCLAETFKQLNRAGVVVFGGTHVAHQGRRVLREMPAVDAVVDGEGEFTFRDLIRSLLEDPGALEFPAVQGVTFRGPDGSVVTTEDRPRIEDLDVIPSPLLTGALTMRDAAGNFPYDVALMETNRGCPYKCSFCYWGGAVGQRMRSFSRERLAEEIDFLGFHEVPTLVLCDSNFGLLEADHEFVEDLIKVRERRGYPRALETSWAKNKSERFYGIVKDLKRHGFKSSFTLALQTLSEEALLDMSRRNMKVNKWESLVAWLKHEGLDCYAELIWGAPGETVESFLEGFDRLAEKVARIAIYPLLLLPNTDYMDRREQHGFVTVRGETDDFEYVLASRSATIADNLRMQRFMFWARILGENQYFRHLWRPARHLSGLTQSQIIASVLEAFEHSAEAVAAEINDLIPVIAESPAIAAGLRTLYTSPALEGLMHRWWTGAMVPLFPAGWQPFAAELYRFESWCRPLYVEPGAPPTSGWHVEKEDGQEYYVSDEPELFQYDVAGILDGWAGTHREAPPRVCPTRYLFRSRVGFYDHLDNHETGAHYLGEPVRVS